MTNTVANCKSFAAGPSCYQTADGIDGWDNVTPPPALPERHLTPPPEPEVDWVELERVVAHFDSPQLPLLQQPVVEPFPQFVPDNFMPPQQLPPVDWAKIAHALFVLAEQEHKATMNNPN